MSALNQPPSSARPTSAPSSSSSSSKEEPAPRRGSTALSVASPSLPPLDPSTSGGDADASGKKKRARKRVRKNKVVPQPRLKVVVRRLPPNLPEDTFLGVVAPWTVEGTVDWLAYFPGKLSKSFPIKNHTFSRAYIHFTAQDHLIQFYKSFNGWLFVDEKGKTEYRALVELAPFQMMPKKVKKANNRENTLDADPDYMAFLESLKNPPEEPKVALIQTPVPSLETQKVTPLIEALRAKKAAAAAAAEAKKARREQRREAARREQEAAAKERKERKAAARSAKAAAAAAGGASGVSGLSEASKAQEGTRKDRLKAPKAIPGGGSGNAPKGVAGAGAGSDEGTAGPGGPPKESRRERRARLREKTASALATGGPTNDDSPSASRPVSDGPTHTSAIGEDGPKPRNTRGDNGVGGPLASRLGTRGAARRSGSGSWGGGSGVSAVSEGAHTDTVDGAEAGKGSGRRRRRGGKGGAGGGGSGEGGESTVPSSSPSSAGGGGRSGRGGGRASSTGVPRDGGYAPKVVIMRKDGTSNSFTAGSGSGGSSAQ
ncbi:Smg-4/UPF3 family-domain-containing protein [Zopfochytrium polystomum]|nr:Smg-4/UPF3 family-domain-containing protein [Zopfochytrium polystomum]